VQTRLVSRLIALAAIGGGAVAVLVPNAGAAPGRYQAGADANLVEVRALNVPGTGNLADATVAPARAAVDLEGIDNSPARSLAQARNLAVSALFGALPIDAIVRAEQTAPPVATEADVAGPAVPAEVAPLLAANVATATARARWAGDDACVSGEDIANAASQLANAQVLDLSTAGFGNVVATDPQAVSFSHSAVRIVDVPDQTTKGLQAQTTTALAGLTLFQGSPLELTLEIVGDPIVTATVTGQPGGATVSYTQPVIRVSQGDTVIGTLDASDADLTVPGLPLIELELGTLVSQTNPDGTSATAQADVLRVRLVAVEGTIELLNVAIGSQAVAASVPAGGIACSTSSPSAGPDTDNDGLTDDRENQIGTDPNDPDTDDDGLTDGAEVNTYRTDPKDPDTDDGGVKDGPEVDRGTDPLDPADDVKAAPDPDRDNDGLTNDREVQLGTNPDDPDTDDDGLTDGAEVNTLDTNPKDPDTDHGGVPDGVEVNRGTDPKDPADDLDSGLDGDDDGLTDDRENQLGTDPTDPDTDDDGLTDGAEVNTVKTDPKNRDTDGGGVVDGVEVDRGSNPLDPADDSQPGPQPDADGDGLTDEREGQLGTNPNDPDTDKDGLHDGAEVNTFKTDPLDPDTDGGGVLDGPEVSRGTNPLKRCDDRPGACPIAAGGQLPATGDMPVPATAGLALLAAAGAALGLRRQATR
jgi:hypothetical protein